MGLYLTADCGENPAPHVLTYADTDLALSHSLYHGENTSAILETSLIGYAGRKRRGASAQYNHCDANFVTAQTLARALSGACQ